MALIAMCFKLMQDDVVQKARWLGQKIGILGEGQGGHWDVIHSRIAVHESSESESDYEEEEEEESDEEDEVGRILLYASK